MAWRPCKPAAAAGGLYPAIPEPPSRTFENLHHSALAVVTLLFLTSSLHALDSRAPLQNVPLPQSLVNDIAALSDATSEYAITVKFVDAAKARVQSSNLASDAGWDLKPVTQLAQGYSASFKQRLNAGACTNLNTMIATAEQNTGLAQPDFEGFHELVFSQPIDGALFLATRDDLLVRPEVEYVGIGKTEVAPPPGATPDFTPLQADYRGPNPGADFAFAHSQGLTGAGMRLSEVYLTYDREHEEFINDQLEHDLQVPPESFVFDIPGDDFDQIENYWNLWVNHGTATLGQNLAPDNGFGVTGMTYEADGYIYQTGERSGTSFSWRFEEAYCNALADSSVAGNGQIVYWEHQSPTRGSAISGGPVELDALLHSLTRTGTDSGVFVVMPAGNCSRNLDSSDFSAWQAWGDSGSMIVGAGSANAQHERLLYGFAQFCGRNQGSSYGQRVGPQGWGEAVASSGFGDLAEVDGDVHRRYTDTFAGTSSATPMVAGAALLTQQHAISLGLTPLDSREMRSFLQQTGIPQGGTTPGNIGAFINVRSSLEQVADADIAISSHADGNLVISSISNSGPRTADSVSVGIIYSSSNVHSLSLDKAPSSCAFYEQIPIPPGSECPGQCPSLLECTLSDLAPGNTRIIRLEVSGYNFPIHLQVEGDVGVEGELTDPAISDNVENIVLEIQAGGPTS